ncbi:formimidoylglutamase [Sinomicrobium soli]|uniref:formimidoylglutamase n=1 Tax=Sinomicrobium sp. N-1-3-6 TaxID=2219864 RepID=UPI000DCCE1AB|nr:formimidoylglutamase [Sinomicrobium sp. N-1-3-6]RAV30058.1 arginase [Sinomicrobium sp. N-1-3-6]
MQNFLSLYTLKDIEKIISRRKGETRFGERIQLPNEGQDLEEQLNESEARYVLFGIPEDIGITGNYGRKGARHAWQATLSQLLNTQHNTENKAKKVLLLGQLDFSEEMKLLDTAGTSGNDRIKKARELTALIDTEVTDLVCKIVRAGKKPVVIGGGHNNCYGIMKGCALALGQPVNCINIDAHTDLRKPEGRHSGNGFSYAWREGLLQRYFIFGLHKNYTPKNIFRKFLKTEENIKYLSFEELLLAPESSFEYHMEQAHQFVRKAPYGIEIDCDAIKNVPSSAATPTGFTPEQVRKLVYSWKNHKNALYLHICEAAPHPENEEETRLTGKLISYLITDFIRK